MKTAIKKSPIKVGVVGARGYSGQELCRLLYRHSGVVLDSIFFNENKPFSLWEQFPEIERQARLLSKREPFGRDLNTFFVSDSSLDVVFLATPNEVSLELAGKFLKKGISVIDLSGVFRLNQADSKLSIELYSRYYGLEHSAVDLLQRAVYGLHPFNRASVGVLSNESPFLIANPGCYVTSVLMAVLPLLTEGLLAEGSLIIDAKSGASGAGKKLSENLLFTELFGDFYPYKVMNHQHSPEIEMFLKFFSNKEVKIVFTPYILPVFRGILSTCYMKWSPQLKLMSIVEKKMRVKAAYEKHFQNYPLVEWGELKDMQKKMSLKAIAQSCMTNIAFDLDSENLIVFSALDNLLKGAASQAIENLNCIYGFSQNESLV